MNAPPPDPVPARPRRGRARLGLLVAAVLLATGLALHWLAQPRQVARLLLRQAGHALGLVITAERADYRLRGMPMLALQGLDARQPGAAVPVLTARRAQISLPWSTLRSRGAQLAIERIELDSPVLHVEALQTWLASRPPSDAPTRIPDIARGVHVDDGRVDGGRWQIHGIRIATAAVHPGQPLQVAVAGHYRDAGTQVTVDLDAALGEPALATTLRASGPLQIRQDTWRIHGQAHLHGPVHVAGGDVRITPATFGYSARIRTTSSDLPLRLGAHGPFGYVDGVTRWGLSSLRLRSPSRDGLIPPLQARGAIAHGRQLVLRLHGQLDRWPEAWPALPPPIGASTSPLPFALAYAGRSHLGDAASLQMRRDSTRIDARFRLPEVLAWIEAPLADTPLPPLDGRVQTPRMVVSGATLEGVEITLDDPALDSSDPPADALP